MSMASAERCRRRATPPLLYVLATISIWSVHSLGAAGSMRRLLGAIDGKENPIAAFTAKKLLM